MMESPKYAIVDLETTGHSPGNGDRIIQIAIVIMKDWCVEKTFTSFIHPGRSIPLFIQDLTNITEEDVRDALPFEAHADRIYELLDGAVFVAHNADFDLPFLQAEFKRAGLSKWHGKTIDTVELAKIVYPTALSYKLGELAGELGIELEKAHRADDDAKATAMLLKACWEELLRLPLPTLQQLHKRSFRLKSNLAQLFFDALQLKRNKVEHYEQHIFYQKLAIQKPSANMETTEEASSYPMSRESKIELLQAKLPKFEERPQQFQMMDGVWDALNKKEEIVIEASTGIGKTLGYLLPAYHYTRKTKQKVGISTYTSHLMDQLLQEELPRLEGVTGDRIQVALLKGMNHYVDISRFAQLLMMHDDSYDETLVLLQVLVWLAKTETGDLDELNLSGGGQLFLEKIRKTENSRAIQKEFDFYERAVAKAKQSDIILTNHAMMLADLMRQTPLFKEIGGWIIDEAHQFIQAAIAYDEKLFSYKNWKYIFGQIGLYTDEANFYKLQRAAVKTHRVPLQIMQRLEKNFMKMMTKFDEVMQHFMQLLMQKLKSTNKRDMKITVFLDELAIDRTQFERFSSAVQQWVDAAEEVATQFESSVDDLAPEHVSLLDEWRYWIREYKLAIAQWDDVFLRSNDHYSTWVEMDKRSLPSSIQLMKKPIQVTSIIERLFRSYRNQVGVIWTSGTMTVPHNKYFIMDQLGISRNVKLELLQAPPSYFSGAKAFVVTDMPDIQSVSQSEYIEAVAHAVTQTVRMTEGRCFVLFTSLQMLRETVELIQESGLLEDYMLFAQGVTTGSRMRLLKAFQKFNKSVLFGTNSFWEGVDVPGDGLASVIVVRLPFSSPDEPTFKARAGYLQAQGRNSFAELSLPEAILRFKQGFGRLIRSSQDKGVFIVLDRRIETKSYGLEFIRALPPISVQKLSLATMVLELEDWYNNER